MSTRKNRQTCQFGALFCSTFCRCKNVCGYVKETFNFSYRASNFCLFLTQLTNAMRKIGANTTYCIPEERLVAWCRVPTNCNYRRKIWAIWTNLGAVAAIATMFTWTGVCGTHTHWSQRVASQKFGAVRSSLRERAFLDSPTRHLVPSYKELSKSDRAVRDACVWGKDLHNIREAAKNCCVLPNLRCRKQKMEYGNNLLNLTILRSCACSALAIKD